MPLISPLSFPRPSRIALDHDGNATGADVAHRRGRSAGVRDHLQFDPGAFLQEFHGQMGDAAAPGRGVGQLAGLFFASAITPAATSRRSSATPR